MFMLDNMTLIMTGNSEHYRKSYRCPIRGCTSKPQKKLSNHLIYKHSIIDKNKRLELLALAKKKVTLIAFVVTT